MDTAFTTLNWRTCVNTKYVDIRDIISSDDGNYYAAGGGSSESWDSNFWLMKFTPQGTILWEQTFGGSSYDDYYGICKTNTPGEIVLVGNTQSNNGNVSGNHGGSDGWIIKLKDLTMVSTNETTLKNTAWQVTQKMPNAYTVQFTGDATKFPVEITLTDALGKNIANYTATSPELNIDLTKYQQGIYFISATGYKSVKLVR
jgi:hypothetical protein